MELRASQKPIFQVLQSAFGVSQPQVQAYRDEQGKSSVQIMSVADRPNPGLSAAGTIGLSEHPLGLSVDGLPLRVELMAVFPSEDQIYTRILATCAFNLINLNYTARPGAIYPEVVGLYLPDSPMRHILLVEPMWWEKELATLRLPDRVVTWLMATPISDAEYRYASQNGTEGLLDLLLQSQADPIDLHRASVL